MATMATRVQRSWTNLRERTAVLGLHGVEQFRQWMLEELPRVSSKIAPLLAETRASPAWAHVLAVGVEQLPVTQHAWNEFVSLVAAPPSSHDPGRLLEVAQAALWALCVFIDPNDACDNDQYDLEVWWSESDRRAVFVCGFGEHFEFRRRSTGNATRPLDPWTENTEGLLPASREVVARLFPDIELVPVT